MKGYISYITAGVMALYAIAGAVVQYIDPTEATAVLMAAAALAGLGKKLNKDEAEKVIKLALELAPKLDKEKPAEEKKEEPKEDPVSK